MRRFFNLLLFGLTLGVATLTARAGDLQVEARLIWGANTEKETIKYEPVDPALSDKLHRMFKWNNYFEITNELTGIPLNQSRDLTMSKACTIRVKNLGGSRVEVSCIGRGKQVHKGSYTLVPPQWLVLGGNDSANTAWFIGLRAVDPKAVDPRRSISKN